MRFLFRFAIAGAIAGYIWQSAWAQDLAPRAYVITPIHANAITLGYGFYSGNLDFGNVPITDATARASVPVISYFHSINFFGRTASFVAYLPYGVGNFQGTVLNSETNALPLGPAGLGVPILCKPQGWAGHDGSGLSEVAAEDADWSESAGGSAHGPVRPDKAD